jgi:hypothetical protein
VTSRQESLTALLRPFLGQPQQLRVHRAVLCTFVVEAGNDADVDIILGVLSDLQNLRAPLYFERGVEGGNDICSGPQVHVYYREDTHTKEQSNG